MLLDWRGEDLVKALTAGMSVVVPYDRGFSDKDKPAVLGGKSAHWCVVRGVAVPLSERELGSVEGLEEEGGVRWVSHSDGCMRGDAELSMVENEVVVIFQHGMGDRWLSIPHAVYTAVSLNYTACLRSDLFLPMN